MQFHAVGLHSQLSNERPTADIARGGQGPVWQVKSRGLELLRVLKISGTIANMSTEERLASLARTIKKSLSCTLEAGPDS